MMPLVEIRAAGVSAGIEELLAPSTVAVGRGERWAFLGGNGSGKTLLSELVGGVRPPTRGEVRCAGGFWPERDVQIVSFEEQLRLIGRERRADESWLMHGAKDEGTVVRDFVAAARADRGSADGAAPSTSREARLESLLEEFRMAALADRGLRFLSTGEMRKAILCRALWAEPKLLILDDPYDGLDVDAQDELHQMIARISRREVTLILVLSRESELRDSVTHVAFLRDGRVEFTGSWARFSEWRRASSDRTGVAPRASVIPDWHERPPLSETPLVLMENVSVSYGANHVLRDVSWTARRGERWHIAGPNGAGKTTLLSLITGSNPKAYGQKITLFGRRRGSGESVWEIKQHVGLVSGDFHNGYPLRTRAADAVISGFTDSAGLYEPPGGHQQEVARAWLRLLGLEDRAESRLRELSYGEQRAVLVARAMVKRPPLLIADEPCQGLDDEHSAVVLALLDRISRETDTCLLYVSHNPHHRLESTTHRLTLEPGPDGSRAVVSRAT